MDQHEKHRVSGIFAAPAKPTLLGAAIFAAIVTVPIGLVVIVVDVLWL